MTEIVNTVTGEVSEAAPATLPIEPNGTKAGLTLAHFDRARHALELAATVDEVKEIRDQAEALRQYARQSRQGLEMQNRCAEIKLRAERRAGEMLAVMPKQTPGQYQQRSHDVTAVIPPTLEEHGITPMQSSRWQAVASIPEERFEAYVREPKGEELTTAGLLRQVHVSHNSGENEWYTPREYIEAARIVLGSIDLDPASTEVANSVVGAATFYSIEDDGLAQEWAGRVWMNPPYSGDLVGRFTAKLTESYLFGQVSAAVVLLNNATETQWFQELAKSAAAICFPARRVRFWNPEGEPGAPLQGQAVIYLGKDEDAFWRAFCTFGLMTTVDHG